MKEKVRAREALNWFRENVCAKKCKWKGIKKIFCYEEMRKIIIGFEDYPVTYKQFIYSIKVKNKICDLAETGDKENRDQKEYLDEEAEEISASSMPDETEGQEEQLEQLELEERREFFWPDSEVNDYNENGAENEPDQVGLDDLEIEKDKETGMYKLKP